MGIGPDQQRLTPNERANLVAYLDGELGADDARTIATKLAHSATARREVESLEKTWELLEYLARPKASEDFTTRTLTEVLRDEREGGRLGSAVAETTRRLLRAAVTTAAALLAFGLGYVLMHWVWPNPSERKPRGR